MALEIEKKDMFIERFVEWYPYKNRNDRTGQTNINIYTEIKHTSFWPLFKQFHKKKMKAPGIATKNKKKKNPIINMFKFVYYFIYIYKYKHIHI